MFESTKARYRRAFLLAAIFSVAVIGVVGFAEAQDVVASDVTSKLPRVDVRHPDFGSTSGCANAADPTGVNDSTCAIQAAIAWAVANPQGSTYPAVYFPSGTYKISAPIRATCYLHLVGDGPNATIIEPTNDSANGFTIYAGSHVQPNLWTCNGSLENMTIHAPGGHNYTATLVELDNSVGYTLRRIRGSNSGGRGLALAGSTERLDAIDTEWDTIRWPIVAVGNELKFLDTQIASGGETSDGYCFGANCVNGVFPGHLWTVAQQLVSASGDGTTATYVVDGGSNAGSTDGVSPLVAGHYFTVAGITDVTGLNGVYQIASVANNTPVAGEYTVTAANATTGTATVTAATYKPTMLPDRTASFYMNGAAISWLGGSIKVTWFQGCFQTASVFSGLIEGLYCEGYPLNNQPHLDADISANGMPQYTSTTGAIVSNVVSVADTSWMPNYVNDPADAPSNSGGWYDILPQDFVKGSTDDSADVPGVEKGQYEMVLGVFAGDGQFHMQARNQGGTAPANTAWPSGSIIAQTAQGNYGTLEVSNSHLESINPPGANWAVDCDDADDRICADAIVGSIPNGYTTFSAAGSSGSLSGVNVSFVNDEWWGDDPTTGEGWVKVSIRGNVNMMGGRAGQGSGETSGVTNGVYDDAQVMAVTEANSSVALMSYMDSNGASARSDYGQWTSPVLFGGDSVLGANPGGIGNVAMGQQYTNSYCFYDVPPSGQTHALTRFCFVGAPNNTDSAAYWEYNSWNGTAWSNISKVTSAGVASGTAFNTFVKLDGNNTFTGSNVFGVATAEHLNIPNAGATPFSYYSNTTMLLGLDVYGNLFAPSFMTNHGYGWGCAQSTRVCTGSITQPSPGLFSFDDATGHDSKGIIEFASTLPGIFYSAAGTPLPTCNGTSKGATAKVSDATAPTYMGAYTSGGAITAAVICSYNGTSYSWLTH